MLSVGDEVIPLLVSVFLSYSGFKCLSYPQFFVSSLTQRDAGEVQNNFITGSHPTRNEALLQPDEHLALNKSPFVCKPECVCQD